MDELVSMIIPYAYICDIDYAVILFIAVIA
jgi:hypothetical protein